MRGMINNVLRKLARDQRGLSTMEYSVLFVVIVVAAVALWKNLGQGMVERVGKGKETYEKAVDDANTKGAGDADP